MGTFVIGEVGEYTPKLVTENDFLNSKLESDTYGIYYSVLFEGDAETYLMQAKKAPEEGVVEYGSIEKSKSGKSMRFKRAKREDGYESPKSPKAEKAYQRDVTSIPLDVWRTLIGVQGVPENSEQFSTFFETVREHAEELLTMIENVRSGSGDTPIKEPVARPTKAATSLGDEFRQRKAVPPNEDYDDVE